MSVAEALDTMSAVGASVSPQALGRWMLRQRWFSGKAAELGHVSVIDAVPIPGEGEPLLILIVELRSAAGTHDLYQLPVGVRAAEPPSDAAAESAFDHAAKPPRDAAAESAFDHAAKPPRDAAAEFAFDHAAEIARSERGDAILYDALADDRQVKRLTALIAAGATVESWQTTIAFERPEGAELPRDPSVRRFSGEQSNSSVVVDERHILKAFRRIEAGINPELEMLSFLAQHGFQHIAAVDGSYRYSGQLLDTTLGIVQRFVPHARDGWTLVQEGLARGAEAQLLQPLADLGAVTAQMHSTLGSDPENPDFAPEVPSDEHLALLTATIDEQIERLFVNMPQRPELEPIRGRAEPLRDLLGALSHTAIGGRLVRCHGDYHLGQALLGADGWIVLDFEGEPNRPLRERRRKRSPLRDVAGMLRSLSYAAVASELLRREPAASAGFESRARASFLDGYMAEIDRSLLPAGAQAIEKQLAIFELEKILYELRYELEHRPGWLVVPVAGVQRLLAVQQ